MFCEVKLNFLSVLWYGNLVVWSFGLDVFCFCLIILSFMNCNRYDRWLRFFFVVCVVICVYLWLIVERYCDLIWCFKSIVWEVLFMRYFFCLLVMIDMIEVWLIWYGWFLSEDVYLRRIVLWVFFVDVWEWFGCCWYWWCWCLIYIC